MLRSELLQQHSSEYRCVLWRILSDGLTVIFNRAVLFVPPHPPFFLSDNQFRMSILERLEQMERRMAEMASHQQSSSAGSGGTGGGTGGGGGGGGGNNSQSQVKEKNNSHFAAELERSPWTNAELLLLLFGVCVWPDAGQQLLREPRCRGLREDDEQSLLGQI